MSFGLSDVTRRSLSLVSLVNDDFVNKTLNNLDCFIIDVASYLQSSWNTTLALFYFNIATIVCSLSRTIFQNRRRSGNETAIKLLLENAYARNEGNNADLSSNILEATIKSSYPNSHIFVVSNKGLKENTDDAIARLIRLATTRRISVNIHIS